MSTNTKLAEALRCLVNAFPLPVNGCEQADRASLRLALLIAREVLAAHDAEQAAKAVPAGFKLVPLELTPKMREVLLDNAGPGYVDDECAPRVWAAMLAAAPTPTSPEADDLARERASRQEAQRQLDDYKGRLARARLDLQRELREQGWTPPDAQAAPEAQQAEPVDEDDQAWDRNAERLTREAFGLGGGINPNATSMDDLFLDGDEPPPQAQQAAGQEQDERATFEAAYKRVDLTPAPDGWGNRTYRQSYVEALWAGWQARAALAQRREPLTDEQRIEILAACGWANAQTQDAERRRQLLVNFRTTFNAIERACTTGCGVKLEATTGEQR